MPRLPEITEKESLPEQHHGVIDYLVQTYHDAALFMKETGFDAAEIHFSHGYGLSQFISPKTNKRKDEKKPVERRTRTRRPGGSRSPCSRPRRPRNPWPP